MRVLAQLALGFLALLAVAAVLHRLAPYQTDDELGDKLRFFADHKDDFDLLIIGSSRTMAGVIPKRIEAELAARGVRMRAFNLAMNAMGPHEADATMRKVLALRPARLRWALAELDYWEGAVHRKKAFSHRTFLWHDPQTTYSATRSAYLYARPGRKRERMVSHLLHLGGYMTALGRGPEVVATLLNTRKNRRSQQWLIEDQGYLQPGWGRGKDRTSFFSRPCGAKEGADHLAFYRQKVATASARNHDRVDLQDFDRRAVEQRSEMLQRAGVVPIHYIPPRVRPTPHLFLLEEQGLIEHLFAFNEPVAYPQLYEVDHRWDCGHLARSGAEMLSALLAERLAEVARAAR